MSVGVGEGFFLEDSGGVGAEGEGASSAEEGVGVEEGGAVEDSLIGAWAEITGEEVESELSDAEGLVGAFGEGDGAHGVDCEVTEGAGAGQSPGPGGHLNCFKKLFVFRAKGVYSSI